jgi:hypothetical protein
MPLAAEVSPDDKESVIYGPKRDRFSPVEGCTES